MEKKSMLKESKNKILLCSIISTLIMLSVTSTIASVQAQEIVVPDEQTFYFTKPTKLTITSLNPITQGMLRFITYESLALYDDASSIFGVEGLRGILAESWGWVDDRTFEIKIRKIARFRSGMPVTADDVVFSAELFMNPDYAGYLVYLRDYFERVEKVDDYTIRVIMKPEYARNKMVLMFLTELCVVPKEKWSALLEKYGTGIIEYTHMNFTEIDGSGAYTPVAITETGIYFERVDNYWGEQLGWLFAPKYWVFCGDISSDIMFRNIAEGARDACSLSAEITVEWQRSYPFLGAWNYLGEAWEMHGVEAGCKGVVFNFERVPLLRERWLREVLTYAIDYNKIAEVALYGQALPANHLSLYPYSDKDYIMMTKEVLEKNFDHVVVDKGIPRLAYDPDLAIQILKEHCDPGSSKETGWYYKGQKIGGWSIITVSGWRSWETATEIIAKNWRDIGIDVTVNPIEWATYYDSFNIGDFEIAYTWLLGSEGANPPAGIERALTNLFGYPKLGIAWAGYSPCGFQAFWNGSYPPLPNIASQVKKKLDKLWILDYGSAEYNQTFIELCELILPELPFIPTVEDGAMKIYNRIHRWVNWPTVDDPYPYRTFDNGVQRLNWHFLKYVYPAKVETVSFRLSKDTAEVGETVTAYVKLKNTGRYEQRYKVAINLGPAKPGWELTEEGLLAWKIVKVPAGGEITVELPITIREAGSYVLVVDNWRIGQFDPGEPLTVPLTILVPTPAQIITVTSTVTSTTTVTTQVQVPTMDVASVAGAGIIALIVGVAIGWAVGSRRKT